MAHVCQVDVVLSNRRPDKKLKLRGFQNRGNCSIRDHFQGSPPILGILLVPVPLPAVPFPFLGGGSKNSQLRPILGSNQVRPSHRHGICLIQIQSNEYRSTSPQCQCHHATASKPSKASKSLFPVLLRTFLDIFTNTFLIGAPNLFDLSWDLSHLVYIIT
ncbi:hypothetical protein BofuT4_P073670.1 [Botrytis cinerea T4]|uniref:Uncharacterized protein n=1 Tax=Botryotinia fuckeliana (strain T4) TaxID=999810 RepID=G2XPE9_BOTF4|nr:hypothetical protein BofuT4_P073670.1 [Botrytis cinerea T4]